MKTIGLLGGMSWPSTIEYYRMLNELAQAHLHGFHSAKIVLYSIDYHEIKSRYHKGWHEIPQLLRDELESLIRLGPDCIVICNNTLHKAFDVIRAELTLSIPVFHIVEITAKYAQMKKLENVLLLGTQFTMEDGFYQHTLEQYGLRVKVPDAHDRAEIQKIQSQLAKGIINKNFPNAFRQIISKYDHMNAVVLACTEIPLVVAQNDFDIEIVNPTELQCRRAFEFAISDP